jgi:hypothetical protein
MSQRRGYTFGSAMSESPRSSIDGLLDGPVGSVGAVELLLLLRAGEGRDHSVDELRALIGSPRSWTELQLSVLARGDLVSGDAERGWRFAPATAELREAVDELARAWRRDSRAVSRRLLAPRRRSRHRDGR